MPDATPIDTSKVTDFRVLKFDSPDQALAEARSLAAADAAGTLRRTGNWTFGQVLAHLSAFINYPYDGYPPELRPPWFVRLFAPMMKTKFLTKPLPRGFKIPKLQGGTVGADNISTEEGMARFEKAWARLTNAPPNVPNPVFGNLTHQEWIDLHLRHSELHLGYMHPR